ncbi:ABC transporter substrate-binding protein [Sporosarcina sp. YIM B06819]|uniref:ABC transporter substrate-binding protein n=1 Tax=Sporosarcina sp. YIM B06819 TaxID=3081769 RepID=UPI00298CF0AD|nr:ABC transporter substrate-binding protein [Sporosarcina sp. YIM B06819]
MKYIEHTKELTRHFIKNIETETTIAQLALLLNCSERHSKTVMKYLHQQGHIRWVVQKGRGKKPKITVLQSNDEIQLTEAKHNIQQGHYKDAFQIIQQFDSHLQDDFQRWFEEHLGLSQENTTELNNDVLRYPFYETSLIMDPPYILSRHDAHMVQQIFDRLVEYDSISQQLLPRIAHHWESSDGQQWTFYLRKGIRFHHGRELTSEDVKATFTRFPLQEPIIQNLKQIDTPSQTAIIFHLKNPDFLFPRYLSNKKASIIPIEMIEKDDSFSLHPVGCGPFQLVRHDEDMVRLDVFPDYYGNRPWLDCVEIIKTPFTIHAEAKHPLLLNAPDASWKEIRVQEEGADYIAFNCRKNGPMQDAQFRRFIYSIVNRADFCLQGGNEKVAYSFVTERSMILNNKEHQPSIECIPPDVIIKIAAQQIRPDANHEREALILQLQLAEHGIISTVELFDLPELNDRLFDCFDMFVGGIALGEDRLLSVLTASQSSTLPIYPCLTDEMKKVVDQKITTIKESRTDKTRWESYFQLESYLTTNHILLFLTHRSHTIYEPGNSSYVNIQLDRNGRIDYRKVWKRAGR